METNKKLKIAFLTEMNFSGVISSNHPNMRTEFAWMYTLSADHHTLKNFSNVRGYDYVFVIFPKGHLTLNAVGAKLVDIKNPWTEFLGSNWLSVLKENNKRVSYIQEGPAWLFTDLEVIDQFNFYNMLSDMDRIYAHNEYDIKFYKGLFPDKDVVSIKTLLIEELIKGIIPTKNDKVIIGGNFARWYGGFQSYLVASELGIPIWAQESHAKRENEGSAPNIYHLNRLSWIDWMKALAEFKYAIHLMPTIAAGTFSLNCAYFGIPCIGNKYVDTQRICHPQLSIDVEDIESARKLAIRLRDDEKFYKLCSNKSKFLYKKHYDIEVWKKELVL